MSFTAKYYQFTKDVHSTKQPPASTVTWTSTLELLEPCSVMYPRIVVRRSNAPYPEEPGDFTKDFYNYCYIEEFSRYYWIKNWTYNDGLWIADLECDVLATYKSQIGSTSLYILRSSAQSDGDIVDRYYPQTAAKTIDAVVMDDYPYVGYSGGKYILNVAGINSGVSTIYQLDPDDFTTLISQLLGTIDSSTWLDYFEAAKNTLFKPMEYINSVMWFPEAFPENSMDAGTYLKIGKWSSGVQAGIVKNTVKNIYHKQISVPKHPKAASRGAYLNLAPYSQYTLEFDPFGAISLDTAQLAKCNTIDIDVYVEALTGQGILKVRGTGTNATACLASITTQIGVPVPITVSGLAGNTVSGIASVISGIAGAAAGSVPALVGAVAAGIDTAAGAVSGAVSSMGSSGSVVSNMLTKLLTATFYDVVNEDNTRNGRPLCKVKTPSSLGGYMIAQRGDVAIPGTKDEADKVRAYLEGGFFYE